MPVVSGAGGCDSPNGFEGAGGAALSEKREFPSPDIPERLSRALVVSLVSPAGFLPRTPVVPPRLSSTLGVSAALRLSCGFPSPDTPSARLPDARVSTSLLFFLFSPVSLDFSRGFASAGAAVLGC